MIRITDRSDMTSAVSSDIKQKSNKQIAICLKNVNRCHNSPY